MSDELVKRLRGWPMSTAGNVMHDAADRIEELEAQLAGQDYDVHPVEMAARIKELEAQLAEATALIAELKGQDDA